VAECFEAVLIKPHGQGGRGAHHADGAADGAQSEPLQSRWPSDSRRGGGKGAELGPTGAAAHDGFIKLYGRLPTW
jgi:hypothetical protein